MVKNICKPNNCFIFHCDLLSINVLYINTYFIKFIMRVVKKNFLAKEDWGWKDFKKVCSRE